jgi:hypothetical protein
MLREALVWLLTMLLRMLRIASEIASIDGTGKDIQRVRRPITGSSYCSAKCKMLK